MSRVQQSYNVNPDLGFAGSLAEPNSPHRVEAGILYVPSAATRNPRPGDALYYDTTQDQWAIPTSAAESLLVAGVLSYRADTVQNAASILEFLDEAEIEVATMGVWWAVAGSAMEYGTICSWDRADFRFDADARVTTVATIHPYPTVCLQRGGVSANGDLFKLGLGIGRVI